MESKIIRILKRFTHRELTQEELDKCNQGFKSSIGLSNGIYESEYSYQNGNPTLRVSSASFRRTSDVSHPHISHYGYYNDKSTRYTYSEDGKLIEKLVQYGSFYDSGINCSSFLIKYSPAGRLVGRAIERSGGF